MLMDEAALVAPCLGYRSATLPIIDQAGHRLALRADANGDAVGDDCRLVLADGSVLPNVYGIGLGSGFRPSRGMGCEPNFSGQANSLWLYQNDIGGTIYSGMHERKAALADTVVQIGPRNPAAGWTPPMPNSIRVSTRVRASDTASISLLPGRLPRRPQLAFPHTVCVFSRTPPGRPPMLRQTALG